MKLDSLFRIFLAIKTNQYRSKQYPSHLLVEFFSGIDIGKVFSQQTLIEKNYWWAASTF